MAVESYHSFVSRLLLMWVVLEFEVGFDGFDKWTDFEQLVKCGCYLGANILKFP